MFDSDPDRKIQAMRLDMNNLMSRFVSLGDNCEFGFVQKFYGSDDGSLLKWCRSFAFEDVISFFPIDLRNLYLLRNLEPTWSDMVEDTHSGLHYHTELHSQRTNDQWRFIADEDKIEEIFTTEREKRLFLARRLIEQLRNGEHVFVFKMNGIMDVTLARQLLMRLQIYNANNRLLHVTDVEPDKVGVVEDLNNGLFVGHVKSFAPYHLATEAVPEQWQDICRQIPF